MAQRPGGQADEMVADLVTGERDQLGRWWVADALEQGGHDQEGVGEHGQGHPAVPGAPAADLVLIQASKALAGLDGLLDAPALAGDLDQAGQRYRAGSVAAVVGQLAGGAAADHEPLPCCLVGGRGTVVVQAEEGPVVQALALGACSGRDALPC
jgi:hypothetical protein